MPDANRPETKRDLAYHAIANMTNRQRQDVLLWMVEYSPSAILVALEGLHWEDELNDAAWDQLS